MVRGFMTCKLEDLNRTTINDARAWGANVIRLPMHPATYAYKANLDFDAGLQAYIKLMVARIEDCKNAGMRVVVDLHEPPLMINGKPASSAFQQTDEFWNTPGLKEAYISFWQKVANTLVDQKYNDIIWGYDLFNEAILNGGTAPVWINMAQDIVDAIRAIDKDVWAIYQPGMLLSAYNNLKPLNDKRVVYSFHFYPPHSFSHQGIETVYGRTDMTREEALKAISNKYPGVINGVQWNKERFETHMAPFNDFIKKHNVPAYIGEFSVVAWTDVNSAVQWLTDAIEFFEKHGYSWCYHAFREWQGWSLEHAEGPEAFWFQKDGMPQPVNYETKRAKVIKAGLKKNWQ